MTSLGCATTYFILNLHMTKGTPIFPVLMSGLASYSGRQRDGCGSPPGGRLGVSSIGTALRVLMLPAFRFCFTAFFFEGRGKEIALTLCKGLRV